MLQHAVVLLATSYPKFVITEQRDYLRLDTELKASLTFFLISNDVCMPFNSFGKPVTVYMESLKRDYKANQTTIITENVSPTERCGRSRFLSLKSVNESYFGHPS